MGEGGFEALMRLTAGKGAACRGGSDETARNPREPTRRLSINWISDEPLRLESEFNADLLLLFY